MTGETYGRAGAVAPGQARLLDARLAALRAEGRLAFVPFVVVGDPDPETFLRLADALVEAGADALELGFPYSDPSADGPVIQAADDRALAAGVTTSTAFDLVKRLRERHEIPISLLVYFNLVLQTGIDAFYARARASGIDAVLVADVPLELSGPLVEAARRSGVAPVFLASAVTGPERAEQLRPIAEGYVYAAARVGITGVREDFAGTPLAALVERLRAAGLSLPILAGFGLSTPEHVRAVAAAGADGAIVGSAIVRALADALPDRDRAISAAQEVAQTLATAVRST